MSASADAPELRTVAAHRSALQQMAEVWRYRELLGGLVRKELKVRYKNSVLGFFWSMIQPVFLLVVYAVVFDVLGASFPDFAIWVLSGLIVWTMISTTMTTSTQAVTNNAYLVSKVTFPRVILPMATLGSALVHFLLQMATLAVVLLVVQHGIAWDQLWLLPLAVLVLVLFTAGLGTLLSVVNVYARDTQHLLDMLLMAFFWATPIIYQYQRAAVWFDGKGLPSWLPLVNPMTSVVISVQRVVYGTTSVEGIELLPDTSSLWYARNLVIIGAVGIVLFVIALRVFDRAEGNFAEVL